MTRDALRRSAGALPVARASALALLAAAALSAASAAEAEAHAVYVFAYASGDEICTESYFTRRNRVIGGTITMLDAAGNEIESADTGEDGNHCFPAPAGEGDLQFVVLAGEGHRGEFTLPAADRPAAAAPPAPAALGAPAGGPSGPAGTPPSDAAATAGASPAVSPDSLRAIVREELKAQIGPLSRALAEARDDRTPGLREIVGGLGWLVGIAGLALWLKRRPAASGRKD
jgi:nickel transport protein